MYFGPNLKFGLKCQTSLIQGILSDKYEYNFTSRLQIEPLEREFGHYRQMSGDRFSVGLKDLNCSETIVTLRSLLKEDIDLSDSKILKTTEINEEEEEKSLSSSKFLIDDDNITFTRDSRKITLYIVGYFAKSLLKKFGSCCSIFLLGDFVKGNGDLDYQKLVSRNGSVICSNDLINSVCNSFAILVY